MKKRLWQWCFPVNFVKFLKIPFLQNNTSGGCFCNSFQGQRFLFIPSEIIRNTGSYPLKSSETQGHTLWNHLEHRIIPSKIVKNTEVFWCFWGRNKGTLVWNGVKAKSSYPDRTKIVIQRCSVKKVILNIHKIHRKTPLPVSLCW